MKLLNLTKYVEKIPNEKVRNHVMDVAINLAIPFNRWLGFHIQTLNHDKATIISPPRTLRRNHVGGAHACALALLGEYPAGVLLTQHYKTDQYRPIITKLDVTYHKQGRGSLKGEALAPASWPEVVDGEVYVDMKTEITNEKNEPVATALTRWQVKAWSKVRK